MISPRTKAILDFAPLVIFLACFKWLGIFEATAAMIVTTLAIVAILFVVERKIALTPLITAIIVTIFGGLTLWLQDERFVKMKPTAVNLLFALILFGGCLRGKGLLRHLMGSALQLTDRGWWVLSLRFGCFFASMALLNELVWRTMPTDQWVNFKVFGLLGCTFAFMLFQGGVIKRYQVEEAQKQS